MRTFRFIALALWALGGSAYAQAGSDQALHQDLKKLRKDYQVRMAKDLKSIDHRIKALKHDARKTENKAKTGLEAKVKELEAQKKDVDKKFVELKKSTDEAFKDLQKGMDHAFSDLKSAVDEASASFKK